MDQLQQNVLNRGWFPMQVQMVDDCGFLVVEDYGDDIIFTNMPIDPEQMVEVVLPFAHSQQDLASIERI